MVLIEPSSLIVGSGDVQSFLPCWHLKGSARKYPWTQFEEFCDPEHGNILVSDSLPFGCGLFVKASEVRSSAGESLGA